MPQREIYFPQRELVSQADQSFIEAPHVPRSRFTGRKQRVTTFDAGQIVPIHIDELYPADHVKYRTQAYVRMSTPLFPLYSEQRVDIHWFFVPNRLLWTNWKAFMGEQLTPSTSVAYTVPQVVSTGNGFAVGSVGDHLGFPCVGQGASNIAVSALPFRAYRLVTNQWYRDENLIDWGLPIVSDGPDAESSYPMRARAKSHDYFTSCLPWPQKFTAPAALGSSAPVRGIGYGTGTSVPGGSGTLIETPNALAPAGSRAITNSERSNTTPFWMETTSGALPQIFADLSSISVNTLRQSFMVQSLLERFARGGTRYIEMVKSVFGVTSPDARQQRSEFLGAMSFPLGTTPIAQTAPNATPGGVGALGGATAAFGSGEVSYAATEHGIMIALASIKSELLYQQGVHRSWRRSTMLDFYWPSLAQMGEQAVFREEIYATGVANDDFTVFGYQERFHELRTMYSDATGLMRSTSTGNIDEWHMGQQFGAPPTLGGTFIADTPPMTRVLAAGAAANGAQYIAQFVIERDAVRPLPVFGTPASLGRF